MRYVAQLLAQHLREYPAWGFYLALGAFLAASVWWRYGGGAAPPGAAWPPHWLGQLKGLAFYAFPYFVTLLLYSVFFRQWDFWQRPGFWLTTAGVLAVVHLNQYVPLYRAVYHNWPYPWWEWARKMGYNLHTAGFYLLVPALFFWWDHSLRPTRFFGCTTQGFHWPTYGWLLLLMVPLLGWASFQGSFLRAYPRYRPGVLEEMRFYSPYLTVGAYQASYVAQFVALEIFFRGFMVMALGRYLGGGAVFPMVALYCYLHFNKPLPETIGSIFGGYILGVVAHYSRSTLGGMVVHVGIALLMEGLAFWQLGRAKSP
jgi:hypothetical protein